MMQSLPWFLVAFIFFGGASAHATIVLDGLTFTIGGYGNCAITSCPDQGSDFHTDVYFGNFAEVGGYSASGVGSPAVEEIRGMSEFDLTGMFHVSLATLTFRVMRQGSILYPEGPNDAPFTGTILVDAYSGNNSLVGNGFDWETNEDALFTDYEEAAIRAIGAFDVVGGADPYPNVGDIYTFNITGLFNQAIGQDLVSLGIRLRQDRAGEDYGLSLAWMFTNFQITLRQVPEPGTLALIGLGLIGIAFSRRKGFTPRRTA